MVSALDSKAKVGVHIPVVPKFFSNKYISFFPFQPLSDHAFREFRPFSVETEKSGLYM